MKMRESFADLAKVLATARPEPMLDYRLLRSVGMERKGAPDPPVTSDLQVARDVLVKQMMPGWMYRLAECCVSDDAWVMPDYNHPQLGEQLQQQYEVEFWQEAPVDVGRRPAGQPAMALCQAAFEALALIEARREPMPW